MPASGSGYDILIYTQPIIVTLVLTLPTSYSSSTTG